MSRLKQDDSDDTQTILEIRSPERYSTRDLGLREGRKGRKVGTRKGQGQWQLLYETGWTTEAEIPATTENPIQWPCGTKWCYYELLVFGAVANVVAEECQAPGLCLFQCSHSSLRR